MTIIDRLEQQLAGVRRVATQLVDENTLLKAETLDARARENELCARMAEEAGPAHEN